MYRYKNNVFAIIHGNKEYPEINGMVRFSRTKRGVLISAEIYGLLKKDFGEDTVFPFFIYDGTCLEFEDAGEDAYKNLCFNPNGKDAPKRAGDLPPLFSADGYAYLQVVTNRFYIEDIVGKSLVIMHDTGGMYKKIACGIILSS